MKLFDTRYIYFIVYEASPASSRSRTATPRKGTIELELREKIKSIAHCHQIAGYIEAALLEQDKKKQSVLVLNFQLLRKEYKFFSKGS